MNSVVASSLGKSHCKTQKLRGIFLTLGLTVFHPLFFYSWHTAFSCCRPQTRGESSSPLLQWHLGRAAFSMMAWGLLASDHLTLPPCDLGQRTCVTTVCLMMRQPVPSLKQELQSQLLNNSIWPNNQNHILPKVAGLRDHAEIRDEISPDLNFI